MLQVKNFTVKPLSMVTREGLQRIDIRCYASAPAHLRLEVYREDCLVAGAEVALMGGKCAVPVLLPRQPQRFPRSPHRWKRPCAEHAGKLLL